MLSCGCVYGFCLESRPSDINSKNHLILYVKQYKALLSPTHSRCRVWMSTNRAAGTSKICHGSLVALINSWGLIQPAWSCSARRKQAFGLTYRRVYPSFGVRQDVGLLVHLIIPFIPSLQTTFFVESHHCETNRRSCQSTPASYCNSTDCCLIKPHTPCYQWVYTLKLTNW